MIKKKKKEKILYIPRHYFIVQFRTKKNPPI